MSIASWTLPVLIILLYFFLFSYLIPVRLWALAHFSGIPITISDLIGMRFRGVPPKKMIPLLAQARRAGLEIDPKKLEAYFLAGGSPGPLVARLLEAHKAGEEMTFEKAAAEISS